MEPRGTPVYIQKLSLAEMVPVRDSFSYNKKTETMSKYQL